MSFEAITSITGAETAAKASVKDAETRAKQMLADAESAGKLAVEAAIDKADAELQELNRQAGEKARGDAMQLAQELESKKNALRKSAEERLDKAARLVVERIVNS